MGTRTITAAIKRETAMTTDLKSAAIAVRDAKSLEDLRDAMIAYEEAWQAADDETRYDDEIDDWADMAEGITGLSDYYRGEDRDDLIAVDKMRMLLRSNNPEDDGFAIEDRDDIIFPLGSWRHDAKREEYWSVIAGLDIHLTVWQEGYWRHKVERGDHVISERRSFDSAQEAADEAVEELVGVDSEGGQGERAAGELSGGRCCSQAGRDGHGPRGVSSINQRLEQRREKGNDEQGGAHSHHAHPRDRKDDRSP